MDVYLPIANLSVNGLVIVALGLVTGLLSGLFGVGGGFLTTPLLIFYGVPPTVAAASASTQVTGASVSGLFAHSKRGGVDYRIGTVMVVGGGIGAGIGALLFRFFRSIGQIDVVISALYVVLLGSIGAMMAREAWQTIRKAGKSASAPRRRRHHPLVSALPGRWRFYGSGLYISPLAPLLLGLFVGIITMLMGVGGGFILVPAMLYILGMSANVVIGTSLYNIVFTTILTTMMHALDHPCGRHGAGRSAADRLGHRRPDGHTVRGPCEAGGAAARSGRRRPADCLPHAVRPRHQAGRAVHGVGAVRAVLVVLFAMLSMAARDPVLVPEVSQHEIQVRQGFRGTQLLLFGAILDPAGRVGGQDYDIVVVLQGPSEPIRMREKERFGGIWINADSNDFRSAPSFFAVASTRPIKDIVDDKTAAIYEFGTRYIQLSPSGVIDPVRQQRFAEGLVDLRGREGLYKEEIGGVSISGKVLYQAHIDLPSNVATGTYTAETFAIAKGRVIASATTEVEVRKVGFERFIANTAQHDSLAYGLIAVSLSVGMGWAAGQFYALI